MLENIHLRNILFLDIETVPEYANWKDVPSVTKELFKLKTQYQRKNEHTPEEFYEKAGIWAEFGKVICISVGYFIAEKTDSKFQIISFAGKEERTILLNFKTFIQTHFHHKNKVLCAHNGKEFDFPYIARRMIINRVSLPEKLNLFGKKPWEVPHLDTLDLWKFGDYKHYTSLNLLTNVLKIPSPKQDIDGSQVAKVYFQDNNLNRIVHYCENDVLAIAQVLLRFNNLPLLKESDLIRN